MAFISIVALKKKQLPSEISVIIPARNENNGVAFLTSLFDDSIEILVNVYIVINASASDSEQSKRIPNRQFLEDKLAELTTYYEINPIKRPANWGGYKVVPTSIEFWNGRPNRLHDRIIYEKDLHGNWHLSRLSP